VLPGGSHVIAERMGCKYLRRRRKSTHTLGRHLLMWHHTLLRWHALLRWHLAHGPRGALLLPVRRPSRGPWKSWPRLLGLLHWHQSWPWSTHLRAKLVVRSNRHQRCRSR